MGATANAYLMFRRLHLTDNTLPSLEIALQSSGTHVDLPSRGLRPKRTRWVVACFRTTGSEQKRHSARASVDIVATDVARTIDIPSAQETGCKTACRAFDIRANDMFGGTSNLSKRYGHSTLRYDPAPSIYKVSV